MGVTVYKYRKIISDFFDCSWCFFASMMVLYYIIVNFYFFLLCCIYSLDKKYGRLMKFFISVIFVHWLCISWVILEKYSFLCVTGGYKDLKIYADLALLSVEGDEQVGRVTNLHSATLGYSSVIYGDIHGENEMINAWKEVWKNLDKDTCLPGKLVAYRRSIISFFIMCF